MCICNINMPPKLYEAMVRSCKPCTYLASRLGLSPNKLSQASTWASSPRSTIECPHNDFQAYVMFGANHAPNLHQHWHYLQMERNNIPHDPRHHGVPSGASKMISEVVVRLGQTVHLSCVKISIISKWMDEASTWASSPRSTIGCVQNDFWAYGLLAQTIHLSCTNTNNISKWTKTRFHMTHVILEFHRVHRKWFLSLWYVRRKQYS
jgi:hypothetical protein